MVFHPNSMIKHNLLFLGGGRRVTLAEKFIQHGYKIFSYETSEDVPIASLAKVFVGYEWGDSDVGYDIANIVKNNDIDLIIPLQDEAVLVACDLRYMVSPTLVLASGRDTASNCFNKVAFNRFILDKFQANYIPTFLYPNMYNMQQKAEMLKLLTFPVIIKPTFGFGSRNLHKCYTLEEAMYILNNAVDESNVIIQQYIQGTEYSVDCYFSGFDGRFIDAVTRERTRVANGEVISSITVQHNKLYNLAKEIGEKLKIQGPCNMQFIETKDKIYAVEINARFGGGFPFSIEAGFDVISLINYECFGEKSNYKPNSWKNHFKLERAFKDYYFE